MVLALSIEDEDAYAHADEKEDSDHDAPSAPDRTEDVLSAQGSILSIGIWPPYVLAEYYAP